MMQGLETAIKALRARTTSPSYNAVYNEAIANCLKVIRQHSIPASALPEGAVEAGAFNLWRNESLRAASRTRTLEQWNDESEETRQRSRVAAQACLQAAVPVLMGEVRKLKEEREWKPIATAPKDETWVLLRGGETTEDDYRHIVSEGVRRVVVAKWLEEDEDGYAAWVVCYWDGDWRTSYANPTHWLPLPSAPGDVGEGR